MLWIAFMGNDSKMLDFPLAGLTVKQFFELLDQNGYCLQKKTSDLQEKKENGAPVFLRGHKEVADFLHCGTSTVSRLIESGALDDCRIKSGKLILYDRDKLIEVLSKKPPRKYEKWKRGS